MSKMKKVVLVIVEGISEETLLAERLFELFHSLEIHFEIQRGDLFVMKDKRKQIKPTIGNVVNNTLRKRKFERSDVLAVIHVADTDGCFIDDENVVVNIEQKKHTLYLENEISVSSNRQKENIKNRNAEKSKNLKTMYTTSFVSKTIPYFVFYFSTNLEHILFNERNPQEDGKTKNIDGFLDELEFKIEDYLAQYLPELDDVKLEDLYKESWAIINEGTNSLQRLTNVPFLFKFITENTNKLLKED